MGKFAQINLSEIKNKIYTGIILKRAKDIDAKLDLGESEQILEIFAYSAPFFKELVFIFTNLKVHTFIAGVYEIADIQSVEKTPGLLGQTTIIFKNKTYIVYSAWVGKGDGTNTAMTILDLINNLFPKLEHTPMLTGFRLEAHLNHLKASLDMNEKVLYLFSGLAENWENDTTACAVSSNDTFVFASKPLIGNKTKRISLSDIKEITILNKLIVNQVVFETLTEKFAVNLASSEKANEVAKIVRSYVTNFKTQKRISEKNNTGNTISIADELLKFKQLLDAGVITQEEFDKKKIELLK
jgi:hypothetical protein